MKCSQEVHKDRNRHKNRIKRVGKLSWFMSRTETVTSLPRKGEPAGTGLQVVRPIGYLLYESSRLARIYKC